MLAVIVIASLATLAIFFLCYKLARTSKFQILGELITQSNTTEKVVALTYDDGPSPDHTNQLLAIFERLQVKATFFVVGQKIEENPDIVRRIVAEGHELGNHSYSHPKMIWKKPGFIKSEIEKTDQLLRQIGVQQEIHFRSPFGIKFLILPYILNKMNKKNIMWNVDPQDYQASSPEMISNYVLKNIAPGSIILLHDFERIDSPTIPATELIIQKLQKDGYIFKTVSQLIQGSADRVLLKHCLKKYPD
jgi:peptidoglycan/xylan/chitin deacetylase (PgdA/CDA1 family)